MGINDIDWLKSDTHSDIEQEKDNQASDEAEYQEPHADESQSRT